MSRPKPQPVFLIKLGDWAALAPNLATGNMSNTQRYMAATLENNPKFMEVCVLRDKSILLGMDGKHDEAYVKAREALAIAVAEKMDTSDLPNVKRTYEKILPVVADTALKAGKPDEALAVIEQAGLIVDIPVGYLMKIVKGEAHYTMGEHTKALAAWVDVDWDAAARCVKAVHVLPAKARYEALKRQG